MCWERRRARGGETGGAAPVPEAPRVNSPAAAPADRGSLVAAIAAAVAEDLGTDVSAIRIRSLERVA